MSGSWDLSSHLSQYKCFSRDSIPSYIAKIAYDGTAYNGWQSSVETIIQNVIEQVVSHPIKLDGVSRTDSGVHAHGQLARFTSEKELSAYTINRLLPSDIKIESLSLAPKNFTPIKKEYHYLVSNTPFQSPFDRHYSWHVPTPLDKEAMCSAALHLIGTHDFAIYENVSPTPRFSTICTLETLTIDENFTFTIIGDRFLYKMARNIVGHLVYIGMGTPRIVTAPAHGLTLKKIYY